MSDDTARATLITDTSQADGAQLSISKQATTPPRNRRASQRQDNERVGGDVNMNAGLTSGNGGSRLKAVKTLRTDARDCPSWPGTKDSAQRPNTLAQTATAHSTDPLADRRRTIHGAKVVRHARSITFQLAEVAVSRRLCEEMLTAIAGLRAVEHPP
jgi:hypothetical protein